MAATGGVRPEHLGPRAQMLPLLRRQGVPCPLRLLCGSGLGCQVGEEQEVAQPGPGPQPNTQERLSFLQDS